MKKNKLLSKPNRSTFVDTSTELGNALIKDNRSKAKCYPMIQDEAHILFDPEKEKFITAWQRRERGKSS